MKICFFMAIIALLVSLIFIILSLANFLDSNKYQDSIKCSIALSPEILSNGSNDSVFKYLGNSKVVSMLTSFKDEIGGL